MRAFAILFYSFIVCSCMSTLSYTDFIDKNLSESIGDYANKYDSIIIIPRLGCNSCTHEADKVFKRIKDRKNILFIFTNLQSMKLLKIENGYDIVNMENVIIDENNIYWSAEYDESDYPGLIIVSNKKMEFKYLLDEVI